MNQGLISQFSQEVPLHRCEYMSLILQMDVQKLRLCEIACNPRTRAIEPSWSWGLNNQPFEPTWWSLSQTEFVSTTRETVSRVQHLRCMVVSIYIHKQVQEHLHTYISRHTKSIYTYTQKQIKQKKNNSDKNISGQGGKDHWKKNKW